MHLPSVCLPKETPMMIANPQHQVYQKTGLLSLLAYAMTHRHSRQWIAPLTRLLGNGGRAHG
jgi:hypothetical protein